MVLVGVAHHPLHGGVVILHPPAPLSSGRGGGAAKEKAHAPPVGVAAAGSASNGGHGCPPAPGGGAAAGAQTARGGGETGGVRHGRRDRRISQVWMLERDDFFLFERGWSGMNGRKRNVWASLLIGPTSATPFGGVFFIFILFFFDLSKIYVVIFFCKYVTMPPVRLAVRRYRRMKWR